MNWQCYNAPKFEKLPISANGKMQSRLWCRQFWSNSRKNGLKHASSIGDKEIMHDLRPRITCMAQRPCIRPEHSVLQPYGKWNQPLLGNRWPFWTAAWVGMISIQWGPFLVPMVKMGRRSQMDQFYQTPILTIFDPIFFARLRVVFKRPPLGESASEIGTKKNDELTML